MHILILADGTAKCLYGEELDLTTLGQLEIRRGSHAEPTEDGSWTADLWPANGAILGPFLHRSQALDAERAWLLEHWLLRNETLESKALGPVRSCPLPK
jgi:hypothetical protein